MKVQEKRTQSRDNDVFDSSVAERLFQGTREQSPGILKSGIGFHKFFLPLFYDEVDTGNVQIRYKVCSFCTTYTMYLLYKLGRQTRHQVEKYGENYGNGQLKLESKSKADVPFLRGRMTAGMTRTWKERGITGHNVCSISLPGTSG
jgi:hypothetical protein